MKLTTESGIYELINTVNNKRYIGQAKKIKHRWEHHISRLRKNKHQNQHLQNAFNKYGESSFKFNPIVIIKDATPEILNSIEELLISTYDFDNELYNKTKFASTLLGFKFSPEQKRNCSIAKDKVKQAVTQYDIITLQAIRSYESCCEAARVNGFRMSAIRHCAKGEQQTHKGYIWRFSNDDSEIVIDKSKFKIREIMQIDCDTDEVLNIYDSIYDAARKTNVKSSPIHRVVNGTQRTAGGYKWQYKIPK